MSSNYFFRFWLYFFLSFITLPPLASLVLGQEIAVNLKGTPIMLITAICAFIFGLFLTKMLESQFMLFYTMFLASSCLLLEYIFILRVEAVLEYSVISLGAVYIALSLLSSYLTAGICYGLHFVCLPSSTPENASK